MVDLKRVKHNMNTMNLSEIIPDNSQKWIIQKDYLMIQKYAKIPIAYLNDREKVNIFLDIKIRKEILLLVKHLMKLEIPFIFICSVFQNPKKVDEQEFHFLNIKNYLLSYSNAEFYDGFHRIGFDLPKNLTEYTDYYNCFEIVRGVYDEINIQVQKKYDDYYSNQTVYNVKREDIRDDFNSLYRDIQLSRIL